MPSTYIFGQEVWEISRVGSGRVWRCLDITGRAGSPRADPIRPAREGIRSVKSPGNLWVLVHARLRRRWPEKKSGFFRRSKKKGVPSFWIQNKTSESKIEARINNTVRSQRCNLLGGEMLADDGSSQGQSVVGSSGGDLLIGAGILGIGRRQRASPRILYRKPNMAVTSSNKCIRRVCGIWTLLLR